MAGLALEMAHKDGLQFPVEIVPGVSAANAAAAGLGAPLMLDFACISLSDLLVPWNVIRERLKAVASADLAVALYNPKSRKRTKQIEEAVEILLQSRGPETPVGIVSDAGTEDETVVVTDLGRVLDQEIHMRSAVIVGNSTTKVIGGRLVTPRGYEV
jgi:precorrin-3B C17-methyltransferase